MYTTIKDEKVEGEIVARGEKTMTVQTANDRVLCFLVGDPAPRNTRPALRRKPTQNKKPKKPRPVHPIRCVAPDGTTTDFPSIKQASDTLGVSKSLIQSSYKEGRKATKGMFKGYQFFRIDKERGASDKNK